MSASILLWQNCNKDLVAQKLKIFTIGPFTEKFANSCPTGWSWRDNTYHKERISILTEKIPKLF